MTKQKIKDAFEELLRGYCCCNFITKKTMRSYLSNMNKWLKTAKNGDTYYFDGHAYTLTTEYGIVVWRNAVQREKGEPTYMTPITSTTDLEAIKAECEKYDIESSGCIEIFERSEYEAVLHFENGKWSNVA